MESRTVKMLVASAVAVLGSVATTRAADNAKVPVATSITTTVTPPTATLTPKGFNVTQPSATVVMGPTAHRAKRTLTNAQRTALQRAMDQRQRLQDLVASQVPEFRTLQALKGYQSGGRQHVPTALERLQAR